MNGLYSTCRSCDTILALTYQGQETHPTCPQTEDEKLAHQFIEAIQRGADEAEISRLGELLDRPAPTPKLGSAALWYAERGWAVFPLKPGEKVPATKSGFKDASTDPQRIRDWWRREPTANIGLPSGVKFDCVDVDGPTGLRSIAAMRALPAIHGKALTPRGMHLFTLPTPGGNRAGILPGVDYRSIGGYVVGVPSVVNGRRYSWAIRPSPAIMKAA